MTAILDEAEKLLQAFHLPLEWDDEYGGIVTQEIETEYGECGEILCRYKTPLVDCGGGSKDDEKKIVDVINILPAVLAEARRLEAELLREIRTSEYKSAEIGRLSEDRDRWKKIAERERAWALFNEEKLGARQDISFSDVADKFEQQAARGLETEYGEHTVEADQMIDQANACDDWGNPIKLSTSGGRWEKSNPTIALTPERREALERYMKYMGKSSSEIRADEKVIWDMLAEVK